MHWKLKYLARHATQKVLGGAPNGFVIQELAKASIGHWNRVMSASYVRPRLKSTIACFNAAGIPPPRVVVEQGTGWLGLDLVLFHLAGARRIVTYDATPWLREEVLRYNAGALVRLTSLVKGWRGTDAGAVDERAERLARSLESPWPALLEHLGVTLRVTRSMERPEIVSDSVDLFYSYAVLQFVTPGDLETLLAHARRFLKPSGLSFHIVECGDVHARKDARIPRLAYLTFSELAWSLMTSRYLNYQNRLRMPQFIELFARQGLTSRVSHPIVDAGDREFARRRLLGDGRFTGMTVDEIATRRFRVTSVPSAGAPDRATSDGSSSIAFSPCDPVGTRGDAASATAAPAPPSGNLHVLYVYANFGTTRGSWSTRAYEFARRWVEQGHRVTVVTGVYDRSDLRPDRRVSTRLVDGIEVVALNVRFSNRDGFARRVFIALVLTAFACWQAARRPYDVTLVSCGPITFGLAGMVTRWFRRRPYVIEVRDLFSDGLEQLGIVNNRPALAVLRCVEDICYGGADAVVALSETMAARIQARHDLPRVHVVPNAANVDLFSRDTAAPCEMPGRAANFLFTGTMGRANDCRQILRAARLLKAWKRDGIHIHLIGDGSERPALEREALHAGLEQVHFVAPMPKESLARWVAHATAMILVVRPIPVFDTVSPNKLFDAFAAGIPVIQTTQGWIRSVLADFDCGITVAPDRPTALAEAMVSLSEDTQRREQMGRNARRVAHELYATDLLATRMLDTLKAACEQRAGTTSSKRT